MSEEQTAFVSGLKEGRQRFISAVIVHGLATGVREPPDFLRHFPPDPLMKGLEKRPDLRKDILSPCTGTHEKIALKMSASLAAESLQIALGEHVCEPENVLDNFKPDDRVTYLPNPDLYTYAVESQFWAKADNEVEVKRHRDHVRFWVDDAVNNGLVTHREVVQSISVETLVACLPKEEAVKILAATLAAAKDGKAYDEQSFLATCPTSVLVQHVPLDHIWEMVIVPHVALRHGFVQKLEEEDSPDVEVNGGDSPKA